MELHAADDAYPFAGGAGEKTNEAELPNIHYFLPGHNLASLEDLATRLALIVIRRSDC
jgi:hypothetical protein